jgi:hypothetical protein
LLRQRGAPETLVAHALARAEGLDKATVTKIRTRSV